MSNITQNQEVKRRLLILFSNNPKMVDDYIQKMGFTIDIAAIKQFRESQPPPGTELQSPVYDVFLTCPCCGTQEVVLRELRASAMAVRDDPFLAPLYFPLEQYEPLNYLTFSVAVCPQCYFASPDKKDFIQYNKTRKANIPSQLSSGIIADLQDHANKRKAFINNFNGSKDFQGAYRSLEQAVISYQLADMRAQIEADSKSPFATVKRGGYYTRMALLQRQNGEEYEPALRQALEQYKKSYFLSDFPNANIEFQTCFIIFSLHLRFSELKEARDFIGVMEQSRKELEEKNERSAVSALNTWIDRAKNRWEDRDDPQLWDLPTH